MKKILIYFFFSFLSFKSLSGVDTLPPQVTKPVSSEGDEVLFEEEVELEEEELVDFDEI